GIPDALALAHSLQVTRQGPVVGYPCSLGTAYDERLAVVGRR
ncbi:MAG: hypothetical protein DK304_001471, partial [Chloroflexi bacterium]